MLNEILGDTTSVRKLFTFLDTARITVDFADIGSSVAGLSKDGNGTLVSNELSREDALRWVGAVEGVYAAFVLAYFIGLAMRAAESQKGLRALCLTKKEGENGETQSQFDWAEYLAYVARAMSFVLSTIASPLLWTSYHEHDTSRTPESALILVMLSVICSRIASGELFATKGTDKKPEAGENTLAAEEPDEEAAGLTDSAAASAEPAPAGATSAAGGATPAGATSAGATPAKAPAPTTKEIAAQEDDEERNILTMLDSARLGVNFGSLGSLLAGTTKSEDTEGLTLENVSRKNALKTVATTEMAYAGLGVLYFVAQEFRHYQDYKKLPKEKKDANPYTSLLGKRIKADLLPNACLDKVDKDKWHNRPFLANNANLFRYISLILSFASASLLAQDGTETKTIDRNDNETDDHQFLAMIFSAASMFFARAASGGPAMKVRFFDSIARKGGTPPTSSKSQASKPAEVVNVSVI